MGYWVIKIFGIKPWANSANYTANWLQLSPSFHTPSFSAELELHVSRLLPCVIIVYTRRCLEGCAPICVLGCIRITRDLFKSETLEIFLNTVSLYTALGGYSTNYFDPAFCWNLTMANNGHVPHSIINLA